MTTSLLSDAPPCYRYHPKERRPFRRTPPMRAAIERLMGTFDGTPRRIVHERLT